MTFTTVDRNLPRVSGRWNGVMAERRRRRREAVMDRSSGAHGRSGWTWKVWVGIVVGLAVVAGLVVLIAANVSGGSGGIY
jgi:hypothetical protein